MINPSRYLEPIRKVSNAFCKVTIGHNIEYPYGCAYCQLQMLP
jgi:hypothetical protein